MSSLGLIVEPRPDSGYNGVLLLVRQRVIVRRVPAVHCCMPFVECALFCHLLDGFTNQPWMLDPNLRGLSPTATQIFRRSVVLYGPYIEAEAQKARVKALEQKQKL